MAVPAGWTYTESNKERPYSFEFRKGHVSFYAWESTITGRWYWNRKVNGNVTDDGNYALRSSARRAVLQRIAKEQ